MSSYCAEDDDLPPTVRASRAEVAAYRGWPLADPSLAGPYLDQITWWKKSGPTGGEYVRIEDMTPEHALAAASMLLDKSGSICLVLFAAKDKRVPTAADFIDAITARSVVWTTPLVQTLFLQGLASVETPYPWVVAGRRRRIR